MDQSNSTKFSQKSKSTRSSTNLNQDIESEDISLSQLELMANKKKLNKKNDEKTPTEMSKKSSIKMESSDKKSISSADSSSSSNRTYNKRRKEQAVLKENTDDEIRKQKSEYLFKFNKLNIKGKWSSLRLSMMNSLDEIKNEYERLHNEIQTERSVAFFKRMLLLGVQGIEMMNTKFDPLGVDLDGWSEAMGYSMENQEYDEVMAELYEKYKGRAQMSPEVKLIFMIISSATMFTISKRITKLDSNNALKSLIGGLMGGNGNNMQQQFQQQQFQQQQQSYMTETSDDNMPSRMNGPNTNYVSQDNVDIENILRTMNERKREKDMMQAVSETSDDILKNIPITQKKGRGRGRPKKNVGLRMG
jgi:hypothetical protein